MMRAAEVSTRSSYAASRDSRDTTIYGESGIGSTLGVSERYAADQQLPVSRRQSSPKSPRFLLILVASLMIVLHLSHIVTKQKELREDFLVDTIKIFHVLCIVTAVVAMVIFVCVKSARSLSERCPPPTSNLRMILIGINAAFSIGGLMIKVVAMTQRQEIDTVCLVLYVALALFCVVQTLFLWRYRKWKCLNRKLKIPLAVLVSVNLSLSIGSSFSFADRSNNELFANASKGNNTNTTGSDGESDQPCNEIEVNHELVAESLYCLFLFGFCVLSITALYEVWNLGGRAVSRSPSIYSRLTDTEESLEPTCSIRVLTIICKIYLVILKFICRYVVVWSVFLCLALFAFYLYVNLKSPYLMLFIDQSCLTCNKSIDNPHHIQNAYNWCRTAFYYTMCTISLTGFILTFRLESITATYSASMILLLISGLSQLVIVLFQLIDLFAGLHADGRDEFRAETPELFITKAVFHIINLFSQTYIILKYSGDVQSLTVEGNRNLYVRSVILFLVVVNTDRWVRTLMFSPSVTEYLDAIGNPSDTFGREVWCQFSEIVTPVSAVYRLLSALMFYDIHKKNVVHSLEPGETPSNSASHQVPNYAQRS